MTSLWPFIKWWSRSFPSNCLQFCMSYSISVGKVLITLMVQGKAASIPPSKRSFHLPPSSKGHGWIIAQPPYLHDFCWSKTAINNRALLYLNLFFPLSPARPTWCRRAAWGSTKTSWTSCTMRSPRWRRATTSRSWRGCSPRSWESSPDTRPSPIGPTYQTNSKISSILWRRRDGKMNVDKKEKIIT